MNTRSKSRAKNVAVSASNGSISSAVPSEDSLVVNGNSPTKMPYKIREFLHKIQLVVNTGKVKWSQLKNKIPF